MLGVPSTGGAQEGRPQGQVSEGLLSLKRKQGAMTVTALSNFEGLIPRSWHPFYLQVNIRGGMGSGSLSGEGTASLKVVTSQGVHRVVGTLPALQTH